ncbi:MAG TPA: DUF3047 domain-containing protein [Burkholderiales bacterium]|nr:DUF3047 domain-containing protein [Burkholderiales bacterium]
MGCGAWADDTVQLTFDGRKAKDGAPEPWELRVKTGQPAFRVVDAPDRPGALALYFHADGASFSLNRKINLDVTKFSELTWSWMVESFPRANDGDQVLQVLLAFKGGKVLSYVWDPTRALNATWSEGVPLLYQIKVIVAETGREPIMRWRTVTRRVDKDFQSVFGQPPPPLEGIRLQSNSQYSKSVGSGFISGLVFSSAMR